MSIRHIRVFWKHTQQQRPWWWIIGQLKPQTTFKSTFCSIYSVCVFVCVCCYIFCELQKVCWPPAGQMSNFKLHYRNTNWQPQDFQHWYLTASVYTLVHLQPQMWLPSNTCVCVCVCGCWACVCVGKTEFRLKMKNVNHEEINRWVRSTAWDVRSLPKSRERRHS